MQEAKRVKKVKVLNQVGISTVKGENSNGWGTGAKMGGGSSTYQSL
jgi:hypothetical protein